MMNVEIGKAAGAVWEALNNKGEATVAQLRQRTGLPAEILNRAIGWLAREEKLNFSTKGKVSRISLRT